MAGCKGFPFIEKPAPLLHVRAMLSCYSMNNLCQGYTKNHFLSSIIASNSFFLSNYVCVLTPSMYKRVKRNKTRKSTEKKFVKF